MIWSTWNNWEKFLGSFICNKVQISNKGNNFDINLNQVFINCSTNTIKMSTPCNYVSKTQMSIDKLKISIFKHLKLSQFRCICPISSIFGYFHQFPSLHSDINWCPIADWRTDISLSRDCTFYGKIWLNQSEPQAVKPQHLCQGNRAFFCICIYLKKIIIYIKINNLSNLSKKWCCQTLCKHHFWDQHTTHNYNWMILTNINSILQKIICKILKR